MGRRKKQESAYDLDGYYCLVIAILTGVDASEARKLYNYGPEHPVSRKILKKRYPASEKGKLKGKERKEGIRKMKKDGYGLETIAEAFNYDDSTVKRIIKKMEDRNNGNI